MRRDEIFFDDRFGVVFAGRGASAWRVPRRSSTVYLWLLDRMDVRDSVDDGLEAIKMNPKPRLVQRDKEPSNSEVFMARIEQSHREYLSPSGDIKNPEGWQVIGCEAKNPLDVDSVVNKGTKYVVVDAPAGFFRGLLRKVRGL